MREGERYCPNPHGSMSSWDMGTYGGGANEGVDMVSATATEWAGWDGSIVLQFNGTWLRKLTPWPNAVEL